MDKIATELQKTGLRINNNFHSNGAANGIPNGVANGVSNGVNHAKNKKQMLIDTINETVNDKLEKIELNSSKDIKSIDDIISLFNLENC
ncbi:unnamed protein product [Oppiella nova]|uniref:Uncharacterized protein n=1 Tax=Oppiella nova TaxID=334625 RepID=A0A7R9QZC4_9ACAR|nr:unnamed protein product [Oppiella nova]CAG2181094.1 unnamed protein product [Oppiella nova]